MGCSRYAGIRKSRIACEKNPQLMPRAIEEMLRFDPPVQMTVRTITEATEIGGTKVEPNSMLFMLIAAANRDPAQFSNPETFDIARDPNQHLSFGEGIHFCLGAPLARLEGASAIKAMLKRFPRLRLADPVAKAEYRGSMALRGLANLAIAGD